MLPERTNGAGPPGEGFIRRVKGALGWLAVLASACSASAGPAPAGRQPLAASPYAGLRYRVRWHAGTSPIAGFSRLAAAVAPAAPAPKRARGLQKTIDLTLERGVTRSSEFSAWLNTKSPSALENILVDEADEGGRVVSTKAFSGCRPLEVQAVPDLDAGANSTKIVHLGLRCAP